jgi:hypothetical protein
LEATLLLPHFDQDIYMGFQIYGFITAEASYITYRLLPITYYVYIIDYTNLICSLQILINLKMLLNVTNSDRMLDCLAFWERGSSSTYIAEVLRMELDEHLVGFIN